MVVAGKLFLDLVGERIDADAIVLLLREEAGLQRLLLSCMQYPSSKKALAVFHAPAHCLKQRGRDLLKMLTASLLAAHTLANLGSDGRVWCASDVAEHLKGVGIEAELERHAARA